MIRRFITKKPLVLFYFSFWLVYFFVFWFFRALRVDARGDVWVGSVNIWGDWALHFTLTTGLVERGFPFETSPLLLNAPFHYPYAVNALSALLVKAGVPLFASFIWPSFFTSLFFIAALYFFYRECLGRPSTAVLAGFIFLLNGGAGVFRWVHQAISSPYPWRFFLAPPEKYTHIPDLNIHWISVIDSMMIPQRAFLLGFPVALSVMTYVYRRTHSLSPSAPLSWVVSGFMGLCLGLLPFLHMHSFLAAAGLSAYWGLFSLLKHRKQKNILPWSHWLVFGATATVIAALCWFFFMRGAGAAASVRWNPGWYAPGGLKPWLIFWWKNAGPVMVLMIMGGVLGRFAPAVRTPSFFFFLPFLAVFVLVNLFQFHPWVWDNTKFFVWAWLGGAAWAAVSYERLRAVFPERGRVGLSALALFWVMGAGAADAWRIVNGSTEQHQMYNAEEIKLAEWARTHTEKQSFWLTGSRHNHWLSNLAGRQPVMAYPGWLWTHGYNYSKTEEAVQKMFEKPNERLFQDYSVDYITLGPEERRQQHANEPALAPWGPVVFETATTKIIHLRKSKDSN